MYDAIVEQLRLNYAAMEIMAPIAPQNAETACLFKKAADAIEELSMKLHGANAAIAGMQREIERMVVSAQPQWIPIESRPMDEEERKEWSEYIGYDIEYEDAVIYTSKLPDDGQEVLVCNKWDHVWIDTFSNDPDYGIGFETNGDMDGIVAWMPTPKPYKPPKEET